VRRSGRWSPAPAHLASISSTFTDMVSHNGLLAVAVIMAVDALLPAAGGIVMLVAGALAAGVFAGHHPTLFGLDLGTGLGAYIALASAGTLGYLAGGALFLHRRAARRAAG
jgi:hypothetical protein